MLSSLPWFQSCQIYIFSMSFNRPKVCGSILNFIQIDMETCTHTHTHTRAQKFLLHHTTVTLNGCQGHSHTRNKPSLKEIGLWTSKCKPTLISVVVESDKINWKWNSSKQQVSKVYQIPWQTFVRSLAGSFCFLICLWPWMKIKFS